MNSRNSKQDSGIANGRLDAADTAHRGKCVVEYDGPPAALFPTFPDEHTAVLWLFDDPVYPNATLSDAGGNEYDLRLMGGGRLKPGVFGSALRFKPGSDYKVSFAGWQGAISNEKMREKDGVPSGLWGPTVAPKNLLQTWVCGEWTLEFRLKLDRAPKKNVALVDMGNAYQRGFTLYVRAGGAGFRLRNYYGAEKAVIKGARKLSNGRWHHIALVRANDKLKAYLDGRKLKVKSVRPLPRQPVPPYLPPDNPAQENRGFTKDSPMEWRREHRFNVSLGEDRRKSRQLTGYLDELRISSVARYVGPYTVPGSFARNYGVNAPKKEQPSGPPLLFRPGPVSYPIQLGSRKHLFIDTALIDEKEDVKIKVNDLRKPEMLKLQNSSGRIPFSGEAGRWRESLFEHNGKVMMFISDGYSSGTGRSYLFQSSNGTEFTMPDLGLIDDPVYPNLLKDRKPWGSVEFKDANPNAGSEGLFKISSWTPNRGIYLYFSPDGINWHRNEVAMLPIAVGGDAQVFWDDQRGLYHCHVKRSSGAPTNQSRYGRASVMFKTDEPYKPWSFRGLDDPYFESWPFPLLSDEGVTAIGARKDGEVFRPQVFKYPWAPDVYLGFTHRSFEDSGEHQATELAVSRDGDNWTAYDHREHEWYMEPLGEIEGEDVTDAFSLYGAIRRGKEIWVYAEYVTDKDDGELRRYARLRHPLDRFAALNAGKSGGMAITHPFVFDGGRLSLNVNAGIGSVKVAILNTNKKPIRGFTLSKFDAVEGENDIDIMASWSGSTDISKLAGQAVRLEFEIDNAKVYGMQFVS